MLTPADIKNHRFQVVGRGFYKTGDVDEYLSQVVSSYEMLFRENKELIRKMSLLANRLEEYRNDEEKIRKAVVQAQQLAARLIDDAKKAAEEIIDNADTRAKSAESIADIRIKKKIDYVEEQIKETFDKARAQAKNATEKAESEAQLVINEAKKKASEIIDEAAIASKQELEAIESQISTQNAVLTRLKEESAIFKADILDRYEEQILLIKAMPDSILEELGISKEDSEGYALKDSLDKAIDTYINDNPSVFFPSESHFSDDDNYKSEITESIEESLNNSEFDDFENENDMTSKNENTETKIPTIFEDIFSYSNPAEHKSLFEENEPYDLTEESEDNFNFLENEFQDSPTFEIDDENSSDSDVNVDVKEDIVDENTENEFSEDSDNFSIVNEFEDTDEIVEDGINFNDDFIPEEAEDVSADTAEYPDTDTVEEDNEEETESEDETPSRFSIDDLTLDDIFDFKEDDSYSDFLGYDESKFEDKKKQEDNTADDADSEPGFTITINDNDNYDNTVDFDFVSDENDDDDSSEDSVGFLKGLFNK